MSSRALIFAGAGASKAVNPKQFPTTVEFFDRLPSSISDDSLFQHVLQFLKQEDSNRIIDIELILWELKKLVQFGRPSASKSDIVAFSFQAGRILPFAMGSSPHFDFGHFDTAVQTVSAHSRELIDRINRVVYQLYGYQPNPTELENNWSHLLGALSNRGYLFDVFTTNYDLSIEAAIRQFDQPNQAKWQGWTDDLKPKLDQKRWEQAEVGDQLYTKLHGSVDWQNDGGNILIGATKFTGDHSNHAIIYPGFKGDPEAGIFKSFHDYLEKRLNVCNLLIFVGFAFRDEYINRLFVNGVESETKIVVINPDKTVRLPGARHKPRYIASGFDRSSIEQALSGTRK